EVQHLYVTFGAHGTYDLISLIRQDLPWQVTGVQAVFDKAVTATAGSLKLTGVNGTNYGIGSFSGSGTTTLTWTLSTPITADRVNLSLSGVADLLGTAQNGGSPYSMNLAVLYGDFDGDGYVASGDMVSVRNAMAGIYNIFADMNGDGVIDSNDV